MNKSTILIFGDDNQLINKLVSTLRETDTTSEIVLRRPGRFNPENVEPAGKVYIVGAFPAIQEAYEAVAEVYGVSASEIEPEAYEKPRKKGR